MYRMSEFKGRYKELLWAEYRRLDQPGRKVIMKAILDTEV